MPVYIKECESISLLIEVGKFLLSWCDCGRLQQPSAVSRQPSAVSRQPSAVRCELVMFVRAGFGAALARAGNGPAHARCAHEIADPFPARAKAAVVVRALSLRQRSTPPSVIRGGRHLASALSVSGFGDFVSVASMSQARRRREPKRPPTSNQPTTRCVAEPEPGAAGHPKRWHKLRKAAKSRRRVTAPASRYGAVPRHWAADCPHAPPAGGKAESGPHA